VGKPERKLGIHGSPTVALHFGDCEVPVENRLGAEGDGFKVAMKTLEQSRPTIGAQAVASPGRARRRRCLCERAAAFDQPIAQFQGLQFMLADMAMAVHASRLVCTTRPASSTTGSPAPRSSLGAKCLASTPP